MSSASIRLDLAAAIREPDGRSPLSSSAMCLWHAKQSPVWRRSPIEEAGTSNETGAVEAKSGERARGQYVELLGTFRQHVEALDFKSRHSWPANLL